MVDDVMLQELNCFNTICCCENIIPVKANTAQHLNPMQLYDIIILN